MALQDRFEKVDSKFVNIQSHDYDSLDFDETYLKSGDSYVADNVEAVMTERYELKAIQKIDAVKNWYDLSLNEQRRLLSEFIQSLISEDGILFLDQDFHLARVVDRILKQESEFLDFDLFLHGENNKSVVYILGNGDVYVENDGKTAKSDRIADASQLQKLRRNICRMRGIDSDSGVSSLNFRYHDFLISAVFTPSEFYVIRKSADITPNISVLSCLASSKLNILFIGGFNSGKSLCMEKLINFFSSKYLNSRSVLLQCSPYIKPFRDNVFPVETEFVSSVSDFRGIFDNILRLNTECIFVDNLQEDFLPCVINSFNDEITSALRLSFRACGLDDCVERLSGLYAKELNTSFEFAKRKIFSKFNLVVELEASEYGVDIFRNFYLVNSNDSDISFDKLEVSADSLASILENLSEKFRNI